MYSLQQRWEEGFCSTNEPDGRKSSNVMSVIKEKKANTAELERQKEENLQVNFPLLKN